MAKKMSSLDDPKNTSSGNPKSGAIHRGGRTALSFKKGTKNYSEAPRKKHSGRLRSKPQTKKPIPGSQQTRGAGESMKDYLKRRNANRAK